MKQIAIIGADRLVETTATFLAKMQESGMLRDDISPQIMSEIAALTLQRIKKCNEGISSASLILEERIKDWSLDVSQPDSPKLSEYSALRETLLQAFDVLVFYQILNSAVITKQVQYKFSMPDKELEDYFLRPIAEALRQTSDIIDSQQAHRLLGSIIRFSANAAYQDGKGYGGHIPHEFARSTSVGESKITLHTLSNLAKSHFCATRSG